MEKEEKSAQGDKSRESLNAPAALLTDCKHKMERTVQKNNYKTNVSNSLWGSI